MEDFELTIDRKRPYSKSIGGDMLVNGEFLCYTLELAWFWNTKNISCVPPGAYSGFLRYDKPDGWRIQLIGVPGRGGIQIHVGNYPRHIKGCVLVGTSYGPNAVYNSKDAYGMLKGAFFEPMAGVGTPDRRIRAKFQGVLTMPFGDYPLPSRQSVIG